jgi:hypothetical protein
MTGEFRRSATRLAKRPRHDLQPPIPKGDDVDLARLNGGHADPNHAEPSAVMAMQRVAGNRATAQWLLSGGNKAGASVQRDLTKIPAPKWAVGRPSSIKAIDAAVALLAAKLAVLPGALDIIKTLIGGVTKAIGDFRASKDAAGKWASGVSDLESAVKDKEAEIDAKIAVRQKGEARWETFKSLEPGLAKYASRASMFSGHDFEADLEGPSIRTALAGPRGAGGELTPEAMDEMTKAQAGDIEKEKRTAGKEITFAGLSIDDVRDFMHEHTNALTGKTMYPELRNVTDPNANPDAVTTTSIDVGGVTMQVEHNPSDTNIAERLSLVRSAVAKIAAAGITVPAVKVHLPKYGRGLKLSATAAAGGGISCEIPEKSSRAVFIPPDFMHLSSEVIGTPDMTMVKNPDTGKDEYKFSSTGFDPSGVASIVHEFGHAIHFVTAPSKYHGLWGTSFAGKAPSGKLWADIAKVQVSDYGTKPREFVAEVFLGLIYGKTYSEDVMTMYRAFGGPYPPALTVPAAAKAL